MQKNIGNLMITLKPHNIGTHLKGIETSFQVVTIIFEILPLLGELYHFLKITSVLRAKSGDTCNDQQ
jgi:hypothetical protein